MKHTKTVDNWLILGTVTVFGVGLVSILLREFDVTNPLRALFKHKLIVYKAAARASFLSFLAPCSSRDALFSCCASAMVSASSSIAPRIPYHNLLVAASPTHSSTPFPVLKWCSSFPGFLPRFLHYQLGHVSCSSSLVRSLLL